MEDTSYRRLSAHFVDFDSQDGDDTFMLHAEAEEHVPVAVQRFRTTACLSVLVALLADYLLLVRCESLLTSRGCRRLARAHTSPCAP